MGFKFDHAPIDPFADGALVSWLPQEEIQALAKVASKRKRVRDEDLDDEELEDEEDDDDDDEDDDEDDPAELRKQLAIANRRLGRAGRKLKAAKAASKKPAADDDEDEEDEEPAPKKTAAPAAKAPNVSKLVKDAVGEVQARADLRAKKSGVRSALKDAGVDPSGIALLLGVTKFDELEVGDDDEIGGIEDVIDELRESYGSLFGSKTKRTRRINGDDDAGEAGDEKGKKPMTATEAQAYKLKNGTWPRGFRTPGE